MFKRKIPTILGLLLLLIAVAATVLGIQTAQKFFSSAGPQTQPKNVRLTNITDTSFTVSYITDSATAGTIVFSNGQSVADDRDTDVVSAQLYNTHYFTVKNLKAGTKYIFKIVGSDEDYEITTALPLLANTTATEPVYGVVLKSDGSQAIGAIVYLNLFNASPLSAIVKNNGNYLITVNNARSADLSNYVELKNNDPETLFVEGGSAISGGSSTLTCSVGKDRPFPNIVLGQDGNCQNINSGSTVSSFLGSSKLTESATGDVLINEPGSKEQEPVVSIANTETKTETENKVISKNNTPVLRLLTPSDNGLVSTGLPTFRGVGPADQVIQIEVHSELPVTGAVKSDSSGNWSWTPPTNLSPGEHSVTLTYLDELGKQQKLIRNFTVEAAGSDSILPVTTATLSSQVVTTPTPKVIPPKTGSLEETLILLMAGTILAILGGGTLLFNLKSVIIKSE